MLEHDRKEPHDSARSKAHAEDGYKENLSATAASSNAARVSGDSPPQVMNENMPPTTEEEEEDDGHFDIDDISSSAMPPTATDAEKQQKALVYSPVSEARSTERQTGAPIIRPSSHSGFRHEGPQSPSEHDVSHSSANHLRQYATYSKDSHNGSSSRDRTPRGGDSSSSRTPTNFTSTSDNPRPRSRNSVRRSHRIHGKSGADRVKAFVVFGADSSDLDTGTSSDDSDGTAVRPGSRT